MITGPTPKPDDERINRNPRVDMREIQWDGVRRGPHLPREMEWPAETKRWWTAWRNSAQATMMGETDWEVLLEAALVHRMIYIGTREGTLKANELTSLLSELRRRVAAFGATIEDRLKLRIHIVDESPQDKVLKEAEKVFDYADQMREFLANEG